MKLAGIIGYVSIAFVVGCGGSEGIETDPGDGSGTLEVRASIDHEGGSTADVSVTVKRAGADVSDAIVKIDSTNGELVVAHTGGGKYESGQAGWAGSYVIDVTAGEDWLDGGLESPEQPVITTPALGEALDPRAAEGGVVLVQWSGSLSHSVRVKIEDFEWEGPDTGELEIPATVFDKVDPELRITRRNRTNLDGGTVGSHLTIEHETKVSLIVVNPF